MMHLPLSMESLSTLPLTTTNCLPLSPEGVSLALWNATETPRSSALLLLKASVRLIAVGALERVLLQPLGLALHQPVPFLRNMGLVLVLRTFWQVI